MSNVAAIIFSSIHNETIDELTRKRTSASIPFGARYRLIDFTLSNFLYADITDIGILTQKNYQSLMDHVGSGKDWDLSRKNGGLIIFPPFSSHRSDFLYENRFEALQSVSGYITKAKVDYFVLTDSDSVNIVDYNDVLKKHKESGADITLVYKTLNVTSDLYHNLSLNVNSEGIVEKINLHSKPGSKANVHLNITVISKSLLVSLLSDALVTGAKSFTQDVIYGNYKSLKMYGYNYDKIYLKMSSMANYFKANMLLLDEKVRNELFGDEERKIYTKVRDSAPTRYGDNAKVENCFIADGCIIEGQVINSIIFRGVKIAKGAVVKNSILMQDTIVENKVTLDHVVTDKNVTIRENNNLSGCEEVPYYLGKYQTV